MFDFNMSFSFFNTEDDKPYDKTFEEFCEEAEFYKPFPKHKEMQEHFFNNVGVCMILGTRGIGKTDMVTIAGTAYKIRCSPEYTILIATKEKSRGQEFVTVIYDLLKKTGMKFKTTRFNVNKINTYKSNKKDPSIAFLPLGSRAWRGRHPDMIIFDDPVDPKDTSPAERKKVFIVYEEALKLTNNVKIIGQPVHAGDLYTYLRYRDGVKVMEVWHGEIPELDHDLDKLRTGGASEESIQASYFGKLLSLDTMPFIKCERTQLIPNSNNVAFLDPSFKGNDFTALCIGGLYMQKFIVIGFCWKKGWTDCIQDIKEALIKYKVTRFYYEDNSLGDVVRLMFAEKGIRARAWTSKGNKHARIMQVAPFVKDMSLSYKSNLDFEENLLQYQEKAEHDDAPDSLASLLLCLGLIKERK